MISSNYIFRIASAFLPRRPAGALPADVCYTRKVWKSRASTLTVLPSQSFTTRSAAAATPLVASAPPPPADSQHHPSTQAFDYTSLVGCITELHQGWAPSRVEEAIQFREHGLALRLRTVERWAWLYVSWHSQTAHMSLSSNGGPPRGATSEAFGFGEIVNKAIKGLVLTSASVPEKYERRAELAFSPRLGDPPAFLLLVEIVGRYSNVILTKPQGGPVLAAAHQVGGKQTSARAIRVGQPYAPPPPPPGLPPDACSALNDFQQALLEFSQKNSAAGSNNSITNSFVRVFRGMSPALARELCIAARVQPVADAASLSEDDWERLYEVFQAWLERLDSGEFACFADSSSTSGGYYSLLNLDNNSTAGEDGQSMLEFFHSYYGGLEGSDDFQKLKQRVAKALTAAQTRLKKKVASLKAQATDPSVHEATSRLADLIMANLHIIKPKATSITVEDWDTGAPVSIPLDETKTPIACAEALYAKARKQRRAVDQVAPLIEQAEAQSSYLEEVEVMVQQLEGSIDDASSDFEALRQVEAELVAGGYMKAQASEILINKAASKAKKAAKRGGGGGAAGREDYRRYLTPGGFQVLAGRNSAQNDELTMRIAQPNDVWMHARGVPGAHVVLRVPAGQTAGDDDLQFAADIAAFYCKARTSGKVEVTCCSPADISKPKGAKPGQVMVKKGEYVLVGRPSQSVAAATEDN